MICTAVRFIDKPHCHIQVESGWPGQYNDQVTKLSDQDVLTEDRRSVCSTACRESEWVHHSLLTNVFQGADPAAAPSCK